MPDKRPTPQEIGRTIRMRRQELKLTQEQLCERMGLAPERISYISAVENGVRADLKVSRLDAFARALETSAANLLLLINEQVPA